MDHWCQQYIGLPWVSGAYGPEAFDCWGLLWHVFREHFNKEAPRQLGVKELGLASVARLLNSLEGLEDWEPLLLPKDGCVVAMGTNKVFYHVGVYLEADGGLVLHASERCSVVAEPLSALRSKGFNKISFYDLRLPCQQSV